MQLQCEVHICFAKVEVMSSPLFVCLSAKYLQTFSSPFNDTLWAGHGPQIRLIFCADPHAYTDLRSLMDSGFQGVYLKKLVPWGTDGRLPSTDLDLGSGHTAYRRASLIDLYLRTKFHWDRKKIFFESHQWGFGQVQSHVTQKVGQIWKIRPDQI